MKGGTSYGGKSHWLHEKSTYNLDGHPWFYQPLKRLDKTRSALYHEFVRKPGNLTTLLRG